jgi:integrase
VNGAEYREKVGRFKDAVDLYRIRRSDALRGAKMPANMKNKGVKFKVIGLHAIDWYIEHGRKDVKNFRIRMNIILKDFGDRIADQIKPSEIDDWLRAHDWAPATQESLQERLWQDLQDRFCGRQGQRQPSQARGATSGEERTHRFLSAEEEKSFRAAIAKRCPDHMVELEITLNTRMRKGEQYSLEWPQVSFKRKRIQLEETKNGSSREIQ